MGGEDFLHWGSNSVSVLKYRNRKLPLISEMLLLHAFRNFPTYSDVSFYFMEGLESVSAVYCMWCVVFFFNDILTWWNTVYLTMVSIG